MKVREGFVAGRSHISFVLALLAAAALILFLEQVSSVSRQEESAVSESPATAPPVALAPHQQLTPEQMQAARLAWVYFTNNTNADTGLVNSVDNYFTTTMWESGAYLAALISARRLDLIDLAEFDNRVATLLATLAKLPLFDGKLPNKVYDTRSLAMVDYGNKPSDGGIGWSSLDIARLLVPVRALQQRYPQHAAAVDELITNWSLPDIVNNGALQSSFVTEGKLALSQEGRLGYEQYAAKALLLFGLDALQSAQPMLHAQFKLVLSQQIAVDDRLIGESSPAFSTSEPYLLDGLEFGFDTTSHAFASSVYRAQEERWRTSKILTAVSEGHLSKPPYFAYATVWGNGAPWAVMDLHGNRFDSLRTLSTKAAFAWDCLFGTEYTARLVSAVTDLAIDSKGWQEGRYESDGTPNTSLSANTNALILESLAYKVAGPLLVAK